MMLSENIQPISYLQANTTEIIENLNITHQPMIITQNGKAAMVIQSVTDYEQTLESLALLKLLAQSQQAVKEGKVVSSAEAFAQLRQRRGLQ
jgi:prevent-host-death family protein